MKLANLFLNRFLYRDFSQNLETKDSAFTSLNSTDAEPTPIASGGAAQDINTSNVTINGAQLTPGTFPQTILDVSNWGWTQTSIFTSASATQVNWGSGTFTSADGTSYAISAGNTGTMAAKTYIYLDLNVSSTTYQHTTTSSTSVGIGKVLIAVAQNGPSSATFNLNVATQIVSDNILANSIDASKIVAGSITATQISSSYVYAGTISANNITAGTITGSTLRTASSGQRVVVSGSDNSVRYYDSSNVDAGSMIGYNGSIWINATSSTWMLINNSPAFVISSSNILSYRSLVPSSGATFNLGAAGGYSWNDLFMSGTAYIGGDISASNFSGSSSGTNTGNETASSILAITGGSAGTTTLNVRRTVSGVDSGYYTLTFYNGVLTSAVVH